MPCINLSPSRTIKTFLSILFAAFFLVPTRADAQWVKDTSPYYGFQSLAVMGNNLIAVCGGEVFRSTDLGNTWLDANNGIEYTSDASELYPFGPDLFVLTDYNIGLAISQDTAQTWVPRNDRGYLGANMSAIVSFGDAILVNEAGPNLFRSSDTGKSWTHLPYDSASNPFTSEQNIRTLTASDGLVYAGCNEGGIFRSSDRGTSWKNVLPLPMDTPVRCITSMGSYVFAGVGNTAGSFLGYIYRSSDWGQTWEIANTGLPDTVWPWSLFTYNGSVFVGYESGGIFRSTDSGNSWEDVGGTIIAQNSIYAMTTGMGYFFAGGSYLWYRPLSDFNNLGVVSGNTFNASSLSVFPNPVTQSLHVMPGPSGTIRLFDLLSRECGEANDDGSGATLDVSNLENGTYFLQIGANSSKVEIVH